jgi:hypothetical protein
VSPRRNERGLGVRQRSGGTTKPERQPANLPDAALYQEYLKSRTWLTVEQLRDYAGFPTVRATREWALRNPTLRRGRRGRALVFRRTRIDQYLESLEK